MRNSNKKRPFDNLETDGVEHFIMKRRKNEFSKRTWWKVDISSIDSSNQGATALVQRCMRNYGWSLYKAKAILKAYRQFLTLKKEQEDWDAKILSPSHLVDQMWHQHILDVANYYYDMILLCGRQIVLHNPDGALDEKAKKSRDKKTRRELIKKFGSKNVNREVWGFPSKSATNGSKTKSSDDKLKIVIEEMFFYVKLKTPMKNVMRKYANRRGIKKKSQFQFSYHGKRSDKFDTPQKLKMQDGDTIEIPPAEKTDKSKTNSSDEQLDFVIKDASNHQMSFRMNRKTHLKDVMREYANRSRISTFGFHFSYRGERIDADSTPQGLQMQHGDAIDMTLIPVRPTANASMETELRRNRERLDTSFPQQNSITLDPVNYRDANNLSFETTSSMAVNDRMHLNEPITVIIHNQSGQQTFFNIYTNTKLGKVFTTYARREGHESSELRFLVDGERVGDSNTPALLRMKDGDRIDAVLGQGGC